MRDDEDRVSAVALVVESEAQTAATVAVGVDEPVSLDASGLADEPLLNDEGEEIVGGGIAGPEGEEGGPDSDIEEDVEE
jgi:hypothetical protein